MPDGSDMRDDHADVVAALFAAATAKLEMAHAASVTGQEADLPASDLGDCAAKVRSGGADAVTLVSAAIVLATGTDAP